MYYAYGCRENVPCKHRKEDRLLYNALPVSSVVLGRKHGWRDSVPKSSAPVVQGVKSAVYLPDSAVKVEQHYLLLSKSSRHIHTMYTHERVRLPHRRLGIHRLTKIEKAAYPTRSPTNPLTRSSTAAGENKTDAKEAKMNPAPPRQHERKNSRLFLKPRCTALDQLAPWQPKQTLPGYTNPPPPAAIRVLLASLRVINKCFRPRRPQDTPAKTVCCVAQVLHYCTVVCCL